MAKPQTNAFIMLEIDKLLYIETTVTTLKGETYLRYDSDSVTALQAFQVFFRVVLHKRAPTVYTHNLVSS